MVKKIAIGLLIGLLISIISIVVALFMYLICFFIFDVRLHSWQGHPYADIAIYYNYMSVFIGFFVSAGIVRYLYRNYPKNLLKSTYVISAICSVSFIISSWVIVNSYLNNYSLLEGTVLPIVTGFYFLVGYGVTLSNFVFLGFYLFVIQIVLIAITGHLLKKSI